MKSAALSQTAIKPDCFRQATGYMQQRCADLDRLEEDKISCKIYQDDVHIPWLIALPSCDFYDIVRTGDSSSLTSNGVSLSQTKPSRYSSG